MYTWNSLGQLTSVTTNGTTVNYRYNGLGERIYRAVGSTGSRYIYDGDDLALEVDLAGNKVREYTYYPGIDAPHNMFTSAGAVYYYATEAPGHVIGMVNASGALTNRYRYSPWGAAQQDSGSVQNPLRYMSRELDPQTGLYYVRNRWYDPEMARFISEDPIGLEGGINLYTYAGNTPIHLTDPTGLEPRKCLRGTSHAEQDPETMAISLDWICLEWAPGRRGPTGDGYGGGASWGSTGGSAVGGGGTGGPDNGSTHPASFGIEAFAALAASRAYAGGRAVLGGVVSQLAVRRATQSWVSTTFPSTRSALMYHYEKHVVRQGLDKSISQYTRDAVNYFTANSARGVPKGLGDGTMGMVIRTPGGGPGGIFTNNGGIVSFWYH